MQKVSFPAPALYGDHHVLEVRRILLPLPGVAEVYASSCFHVIEVDFDPDQVSSDDIASILREAGYPADPAGRIEAVVQVPRSHAVIMEQNHSVGFQQETAVQKHSAWPCPGMGLLHVKED